MKKTADQIKILVGCEESQAVTIAFRKLGFEAYSCDLLPCSGGHSEWHLQTDVLKVIKGGNLITESGKEIFIEKYNQIIQPYQFGHTEKKATCLWIYNLPELKQTKNVYKQMMLLPYKERCKIHYMSGKQQAKNRSKTFPGIAKAMADQWGEYLLSQDL